MKIRTDFVTNSSSSSFLICKKYLDEDQLNAIRHHSELGKKLDIPWAEESWHIEENDLFITGSTDMDNFDISELFKIIGVNKDAISWGDYPFALPDKVFEPKEEKEDFPSWKDILNDIMKNA